MEEYKGLFPSLAIQLLSQPTENYFSHKEVCTI